MRLTRYEVQDLALVVARLMAGALRFIAGRHMTKAPPISCVVLVFLLTGSAWAHEHDPPAYRPPLLITVHDAQAPGLQCTAAAIKGGGPVVLPLTLLASACATWTEESCEIWVPQSGPALLWSVTTSLMSPNMILGHETMHCWLHDYHGVLPWP